MGGGNVLSIGLACGVGGLAVYIIDALVLAIALADVANPTTTFAGVLLGFAPVQIPLAILESFASVGIIRLLAVRRPSLLPQSLQKIGRSSGLISTITIFLLAVGVSGCSYEGIDGSVFGATAESAGRGPSDSLVDLSQGEVGLAMSIIILFGLGFIAGRVWERLFETEHDALPR